MKFIFVLVVIGIILYGFFLWRGGRIETGNTASVSGSIASPKSIESVLGAGTVDFSRTLTLGASKAAEAITHTIQLSLEELVRGQLIDQVLRLYDQLSSEEKSRVKESICTGP